MILASTSNFACKSAFGVNTRLTNSISKKLKSLSIKSNIDYNILYFCKLPSKSIISLLFGELSNMDYFFTFSSIDSQPWFYPILLAEPSAAFFIYTCKMNIEQCFYEQSVTTVT